MNQDRDDRSLRGLLLGQFLGAFNDNAFKLLLALLALRELQARFGVGTADYELAAQDGATSVFLVFTLPLMLGSLPAAWLADRLGKRSILVGAKLVELCLMFAGTFALWLEPRGGTASLAVLAAMGAQSAFFGPAKYGILPELLPRDRLMAGNGRLEAWTFVAIIAGTVAGGALLDLTAGATWIAGLMLTALSLLGFLAIRTVAHVPPALSADRAAGVLAASWRAVRTDRVLGLCVAGSVFFWTIAALISQDVLVYGKAVLDLSDTQAGVPLGVSVLGIGFGAFLVGRLSRVPAETGWIPLGMVVLAVACLALGLGRPGFHGTLWWMAVLGVGSGMVVVPINTLLQLRAPAARRGAVIALANALSFAGVLAGTLGCSQLARLGFDSGDILVWAAVLVLAATAWAIWLLPLAGLRLFLVLLTQCVYRLTVRGRANVPLEGGALLVCNHVSFIDGLLIQASVDRPVRFLVDEAWFRHPLLRPIMKLGGFLPISQDAEPRKLLEALRAAGALIDQGEVVCIFPEGEITRSGQLLPFRRGFGRILNGRDVPIVPVHLDRLWGSVFSYASGRPLRRMPRRVPYPVTVTFGAALTANSPAHAVRSAVAELEADAWQRRRDSARPLHHDVVSRARRGPFRLCSADTTRPRVTRLGLLTAAIALARGLRETWRGQDRVGVLLPPSVGAAAVNLAALLAGRCVVNLNYTTGGEAFASCVRQSGLRSIVTSRRFLDNFDVALPDGVDVVHVEDLRARVTRLRRCVAALAAMFLPVRRLERRCGAERRIGAADAATVIFSSGSTGEPKGVVLSHFNIAANSDAAMQALPIGSRDRLLGILPLFHSFGTLALWLTLRHGIATVYHPNPLDAAAVGELVRQHHVTILIATPTFLQLYLRRVQPGQFGSLRLCITGAERLPERVAEAFESRFGIRPLEGYGTTECAPVVAVNTPGYRAPGFFQTGARRGTVGRPMPGVAVRVTCLDTGVSLPPGESGMLWVRGPNVMQGYLEHAELTREVLVDGWYRTGDVARVDEDGFLTITDRLSRFSKIGGEMVPHGVVESALQAAAGRIEPAFAVTGLPCPKKGERLCVLHTVPSDTIPELLDALAARELPNLFVPRRENFVHVDELPMLGTGKLDLRAVKALAEQRLEPAPRQRC